MGCYIVIIFKYIGATECMNERNFNIYVHIYIDVCIILHVEMH